MAKIHTASSTLVQPDWSQFVESSSMQTWQTWIACLQIVVLAYVSIDAFILLKALNSVVPLAMWN